MRDIKQIASEINTKCPDIANHMQQHEITIEDIKALVDNETVNLVIGEVYNSISRDIDQLRANLEA